MFSLSQTDDELKPFAGMEYNLKGLPHINESAEYFTSLKVKLLFATVGECVHLFKLKVSLYYFLCVPTGKQVTVPALCVHAVIQDAR